MVGTSGKKLGFVDILDAMLENVGFELLLNLAIVIQISN